MNGMESNKKDIVITSPNGITISKSDLDKVIKILSTYTDEENMAVCGFTITE